MSNAVPLKTPTSKFAALEKIELVGARRPTHASSHVADLAVKNPPAGEDFEQLLNSSPAGYFFSPDFLSACLFPLVLKAFNPE